MKNKIKNNLRYNLSSRFNKINLNRFKHLKGFPKRTSLVLLIVLLILLLQKINLKPTNSLLEIIGKNVKAEFNLVKETRSIFNRAENLISNGDRILNVFGPMASDKYPSPISGTIHRDYKKGQNEGVDIKSKTGEDPKAIIDGKVTNVEIIDKKGYFVTMEKENLQITYGYLSKAHVEIGETISKGKAIGVLGTNRDQGKYLRLELKIDGETVNPSQYISIK